MAVLMACAAGGKEQPEGGWVGVWGQYAAQWVGQQQQQARSGTACDGWECLMACLQGCRCMHVRTVPPGRYLSSPGRLNLQKRLLAGAQSAVRRVRSAASATPGLTLASFRLSRMQPDCVVALFQSTHKCMGPSGCWPDWTCVCSGHRAAGPGSAAEEGWHVPGPAQPGWRGLWHGRFGVCAMAALGRLCWCAFMLKGKLLMWAAIGHACMTTHHVSDRPAVPVLHC